MKQKYVKNSWELLANKSTRDPKTGLFVCLACGYQTKLKDTDHCCSEECSLEYKKVK